MTIDNDPDNPVDNNDDDPGDIEHASELPEVLLIDPERADLKDPLELLIAQEQLTPPLQEMPMKTADNSVKPPRANKLRGRKGTDAQPPELPPLSSDGLAHAEPHAPLPAPPDKPVVLDTALGTALATALDGLEIPLPLNAPESAAPDADDDPEDAVARRLATREYIEDTRKVANDALTDPHDAKALLCNPFTTYLPHLAKSSDALTDTGGMHEYLAINAITTSLGYAVVAQLLAEFRKLSAPQIPEPEIDVFSNYQELYDEQMRAERTTELGYTALPVFHAVPMAGVYMRLLFGQRADPKYGPRWPAKPPHEILHEMQTGDRAKLLMAAYAEIDKDIIGRDNPALANIEAALEKSNRARDEANAAKFPAERDYVLRALQKARPSPFTDDVWDELPLYIQYRYSVMVYNQYINAIRSQRQDRERNLENLSTISDLAQQVGMLHLEIEAAFKTAEVQAAFAQGKLEDSRHDIRIKVKPAEPKQPHMQRSPAPDQRDMPDDEIPPL